MRRTAKSTSVALGEHFTEFIDHQVSTGRFGSASEVIREGLRILEERETRLSALRTALEDGERSGFATAYSIERVLSKTKRAPEE